MEGKSVRYLVRKSPELAEQNVRFRGEVGIRHQIFGEAYSLLVVRCEEDLVVLRHVGDDVLYVLIVARVSLIDGVKNGALKTLLLCDVSFFIHISATYHLHTKVKAERFRSLDFHRDGLLHALQVVLESVHDYNLLAHVEGVGHLLSEGFNSGLNKRLFGVDVEQAISLTRKV